MQLHSNPASPFGRKVKVVAHETGQFGGLTIHTVQTSAVAPDPGLVADNPLGKIPCLVLADGGALYDSRVICEYLDTLHAGPPLFPAAGTHRWRCASAAGARQTGSWMPHCSRATRASCGRRSSAGQPGSTASSTRFIAPSIASRPQRRGISAVDWTSARSPPPAPLATWISASRAWLAQ